MKFNFVSYITVFHTRRFQPKSVLLDNSLLYDLALICLNWLLKLFVIWWWNTDSPWCYFKIFHMSGKNWAGHQPTDDRKFLELHWRQAYKALDCVRLRCWKTDSSLTFTPHCTLQPLCRYSLTRTVTTTRARSSCRRRRRRRMWRRRRRRRPAVFGFLCYAHQLLASLVLRDPNTAFISTHIVIDWLRKEGT